MMRFTKEMTLRFQAYCTAGQTDKNENTIPVNRAVAAAVFCAADLVYHAATLQATSLNKLRDFDAGRHTANYFTICRNKLV